MSTSFTDTIADINRGILELRKAQPEAMEGFSALARGAMQAGELDAATKELIALAIGVAGHCDGCIGFHSKALVRLGVSRAKLMETLAVAVYMGGGPSLMYAADAVHAYDEFATRQNAG